MPFLSCLEPWFGHHPPGAVGFVTGGLCISLGGLRPPWGWGRFWAEVGGEQIRLCLPSVQKINQLLCKSFMETGGGVTCVEISTDVKLKQK